MKKGKNFLSGDRDVMQTCEGNEIPRKVLVLVNNVFCERGVHTRAHRRLTWYGLRRLNDTGRLVLESRGKKASWAG